MSKERKLDKALVLNVLNYWYSFDFLNQSSLQTELSRQEQELLESAMQREGSRQMNSITCRDPFVDGEDFNRKMTTLLKERHMGCCGNVTVYLGSVSKNYCIKTIIDAIGSEPQREASLSKLAVASVQITPEGAYVPFTFTLSPVLWSMNRILSFDGKVGPGMIAKEIYDAENRKYETSLIGIDDFAQQDRFKRIADELIAKYVTTCSSSTEESKASNEVNLYYRMYKNEREREKREGDYHGLAHDYYASDLDMLIKEVNELKNVGSQSMKRMLMYYIQAAFDKERGVNIERKDLLPDSEKEVREKQYKLLSDILDIRRAPIGKWPSKYSPFLMQQAAINLAIDDVYSKEEEFKDNMRLFSINGAPGTGKTTMIKEIIANNIVMRACIMNKIDDPDYAFEECSFEHGPDPKNNSYTKYSKHYYRLRNNGTCKALTNYGIVVTSNNNMAVENITTLIPDLYRKLHSDYRRTPENRSVWMRRAAATCRNAVYDLFDGDIEAAIKCTLLLDGSNDDYSGEVYDENHSFLWEVFTAEDMSKVVFTEEGDVDA